MASIKRSFRPMFLGPTINKLLARMGAKTSDSDLAAKWAELIGGDSSLVKISRGVRDRTAYVKANNPSARLFLSYQTSDMIKKINDYFGYNAVAKIVIR